MNISDFVNKYDPENQFKVLVDTHKQVEFAWNNKINLSSLKGKEFNSVVVTGLGGSAISADLMQNFLSDELKVPYLVNRNYNLPSFVNENSLLIVSSYSGNTEETVEVFSAAVKRGCSVVCISTGGKVEKIAAENNIPVVEVQPGLQPRYALGLSFFSLLKILQELNIIANQDEVVNKIIALWKKNGEEFAKDGNTAFNYAQDLIGFIPTIYSVSDKTSAVGYRLKCQFNENSKLHAFSNNIPELNHNEIIGWETYSEKQYLTKVINILDPDYHPQIKKRFQISSELIAGKNVEIINLVSNQNEFKLRLMDLVYLGDWITYYTAILRGFDPTEIDNIHILKKRLA